MHLFRNSPLALLLGMILLGSASVGAQSNDAPLNTDFGETINIKVISVPVYVTDKKGNPIRGLEKEDFILLEDGKPVNLTNFYEVSDGRRLGEEGEPVEAPDPLRASEPELIQRRPQVPDDQMLHVIVYVDHFNIRPFNRNRVFRFVREFLRKHVDRDDRVMLASYNRSVKVERPFTSDAQVISRALFELEKHTGGRTNYDSERRDLLRDMMDTQYPSQVESRVRLQAESIFNDMQFTLDGLKDMVTSLSGLPGRKALLYVSDGLPQRAGDDLFQAAAERFPDQFGSMRLDALQFDSTRRLSDIANTAAANNVAFYTMDATGLLGRSSLGAEYQANFTSVNIDSIAAQNMQSSIQFLADETGGQFIVNTNNFDDGFDRFGSDFANYYSLGFSPGHAGSGRRYDLKCRLKEKRKGVVCRTKRSYRDKSVETEMGDVTLASLRYGYERNPLGVKLVKRDEIASDNDQFTIHVDAQIPLDNIVLIPRAAGEVYEASIRVWVQAQDSKGGLSDVTAQRVPIEIPRADIEAIKGKYWAYTMPMRVRAGDQKIAVTVRDDLAGKSSVVSRVMSAGSSGP
ncbi:MAG: VWA domain-containing protein [Acidobacteriota bacterium]